MNIVETILNSSLTHCLGWTLVHFLWQGAVVGVIYAGVRQFLCGKSSSARYNLALGALTAMAVLPIITFIYLTHATLGTAVNETLHGFTAVSVSADQVVAAPFSLMHGLQIWLQPLIPWTVPLWLAGVCAATMRIFRSWHHAYQLRETAIFAPLQEWESVVKSLCTFFGMTKIVRLAVSARITVPCVIGWLKPIILIPPSVIAGLTPLQMELILAHELAHIRRQDYLWNILQLAVETLLFYHPVVRWISHQGRLEREKCCDDMVVQIHGNSVEYARALTELESLRQPHSALVLGANGGQVMERIHRLLGISTPDAPSFWLPLLLVAGLLISTGILQLNHQKSIAQSLLSEKYTLLATVQQQNIPATGDSASTDISPTQLHPVVALQPAGIRQVRIPDKYTRIELFQVPRLAETKYPARAVVNGSALKSHDLETQRRTASTIIETHAPNYPAQALERGIEGSATVKFMLTNQGSIIDMQVTHVTGSRLFGLAAMDALRLWKISPATVAGVPVAQRMTEEFTFDLQSPTAQNGRCKIPMGYHVCTSN